jgi:tetratricopeptide (TPR) repeat protein
MADVWRFMAQTYLLERRYDEAVVCCRRSQALAERVRDDLRVGGARYVLAGCFELMGRLGEAADLLEQVVEMDRTYNLPKLHENLERLETLRARLAEGARA